MKSVDIVTDKEVAAPGEKDTGEVGRTYCRRPSAPRLQRLVHTYGGRSRLVAKISGGIVRSDWVAVAPP